MTYYTSQPNSLLYPTPNCNLKIPICQYCPECPKCNPTPTLITSHVDEVEPAQCLRQAGDDGSIPLGIVIKLEQGGGHQLVVAGHGKVGLLVELHQEQLAVLLGLGDVRRYVGVLGWLKVWSPPVAYGVLYGPVSGGTIRTTKSLCHQPSQTINLHKILIFNIISTTFTNLILSRVQFSSWQLEESCSKLEQEDVRKAMLMDKQDSIHRSPHPILVILVPHPLEPGGHTGVLLEQGVLGPEGVVGEGVEVDCAAECEGRVLGEAGLAGLTSKCGGPACAGHGGLGGGLQHQQGEEHRNG